MFCPCVSLFSRSGRPHGPHTQMVTGQLINSSHMVESHGRDPSHQTTPCLVLLLLKRICINRDFLSLFKMTVSPSCDSQLIFRCKKINFKGRNLKWVQFAWTCFSSLAFSADNCYVIVIYIGKMLCVYFLGAVGT